jgi:AAA+ superfamily predicted ATPase
MTREELVNEKAFLDNQDAEEQNRRAERKKEIERLLRLRYKSLPSSTSPAVPVVDGAIFGLGEIPQFNGFSNGIGDLNLLISDVPIAVAPFAQVVHGLAKQLVRQIEGAMPEMGVYQIFVGTGEMSFQVVKWEVPRPITVEELHTISRLVSDAYQGDINAYNASSLGWKKVAKPKDYSGNRMHAGTHGVFFGVNNQYSQSANGVTVYRKFKNAKQAEYFQSEYPIDFLSMQHSPGGKVVTYVELHDHGVGEKRTGLGQDSFLMLVTQISRLLAKQEILKPKPLMAEIYRQLNRIGTRTINRSDLFGMHDALEAVEKTVLLPLQHPTQAARFSIMPESVLLVGVPGVGKTYLEHYLMTGEYNAIFVAVDSDKLRTDLHAVKAGRPSETLTRVDRITQLTGLPVILIIDDIDVILTEKKEDDVISKFLNLMQGIRQKGLYVLASTNYPEELDRRLLEPGRLSKIVHVRPPSAAERKGVVISYLVKQPFATTKQREEVANWCVEQTEGWTQRFLWELTVEGARNCMIRSLQGTEVTPALADYQAAFETILRTRNFDEVREWDERIANFVSSHRRKIGFGK